ncbi:RAMP superfamily CRISPR-associated protein [Gandjariella thermophila]|uniref:CRISPR type III-associated protein domain-containing protein n=1 Tax=Gandjariella thermophila TaxID=1931992 RepID=A0A4D4JD67_9PSEU|nr:RAMP superfamily CRISPR-associated protein [Gandjariella thermophila]GDY31837.1 hypothetical protein GTS_34700 [Gandjariella thermophila]
MRAAPAALPAVSPVVVRMLSDWHVGAGHGIPGDVDAVVRRDADGLPYVPGTSLTGVLREACRVVAIALDDGAVDGVWQRWHRHVFGAPPTAPPGQQRQLGAALVGIGAARLSPALRARLRRAGLVEATTIRRAGVAIDRDTGRALDRALRFTEVARGGMELHAELVIDPFPDDADQRTAVTALLMAGAGWCAQLGGDRRRGLGRVQIGIGGGQDSGRWVRWLADTGWTPPEPRPAEPRSDAPPAIPAHPAGGDWVAADLMVTTTAPVRVSSHVTGNIVRGLDYVPGSLLLPWLSQRWGAERVRRAIWEQALVIRHALPEVAGRRGMPVPLSLYRSRDGDQRDLRSASHPVDDLPLGWRQVREAYTDGEVTDGEVTVWSSSLARISHNTVEEVSQRPNTDMGIFELEVIPAGTRLRGRVIVRWSVLDGLADPWQALAGPARLGARRRGEYGAVTVEARETAMPEFAAPGEVATLWAVSDLAVRGRGLRLSASPRDAVAAMAAQLGVAVELVDVTARTRRRDSWQRSWQLPRESIVGLAAGTVLTIRFPDGPPPAAAWAELLRYGLGDRVAEGYGELVADAPLLAVGSARIAESTEPPGPSVEAAVELSGADEQVFQVVTAAVVAERARMALPDARAKPEYDALAKTLGKLSRSQRGAWRATAVAAAVAGNLRPVTAKIGQVSQRRLPRREPERQAAEVINCLVGRQPMRSLRSWWDVLAAEGIAVRSDRDRAAAFAALVADVVDKLRREDAA